MGQQLAQLVQVRDDLRDVFGKTVSPDLATGKITYPLACYLDTASDEERQELLTAIAKLTHSDSTQGMDRVRRLLYQRGAVQRAAEQLERCRHAIHTELAPVPAAAPGYLRLVLDIVDGLASGVYVVPELSPSAALRCPGRGPFATRVLAELDQLRGRLTPHGLPTELPALLPWHQPHWMYSPNQHAIFFPDVDDLGDEILPFQAALLGTDDLEEPRRLLTAQIPLVLAHEMFHFWRDAAGRLTDDHWHEEHAANALAVAYAREHEPEALASALQLAHQVIATSPDALDDEADQLLEDCRHARVGTEGYGMTPAKIAVVGLEMVRRLATRSVPLSARVAELLGPASPREANPGDRKAAS